MTFGNLVPRTFVLALGLLSVFSQSAVASDSQSLYSYRPADLLAYGQTYDELAPACVEVPRASSDELAVFVEEIRVIYDELIPLRVEINRDTDTGRRGKWGFIDREGNFVIAPTFDSALGFSEGLAAVLINGKYGFIDKTGKLAIQPKFLQADFFREGRCLVLLDNDKLAYIDTTGEKAFPQEFPHHVFHGSHCSRADPTSDIIYHTSTPLATEDAERFHNGVAQSPESDMPAAWDPTFIDKYGHPCDP